MSVQHGRTPCVLADLVLDQCARGWGDGGCLLPSSWTADYVADVEPPAASPAWPLGGVDHASASGGVLTISGCGTDLSYYTLALTPAATDVLILYARVKASAGAAAVWELNLRNGHSTYSRIRLYVSDGAVTIEGTAVVMDTTSDYVELVLRLDMGDQGRVWRLNGAAAATLLWAGRGVTPGSTSAIAAFGKTLATSDSTNFFVGRVAVYVGPDPLDAAPCYRTYTTCQNQAQFARSSTSVRLALRGVPLPRGEQAHQAIDEIEHVPTQIDSRRGLGRRDRVVLTLADWTAIHHYLDPYYRQRAARHAASWTSVFTARDEHYQGRTLRLREGWLDADGRIDIASMALREYVIDAIDGPDRGVTTITADDVLTDLAQVMVPSESSVELLAGISAVATSFSVTDSSDVSGWTAPLTVRIDDEIITVGAFSGVTASSLTRGAWGTTAATHDADAAVQECATWSAQRVDLVWADLLARGGVAASRIDSAGAATEAALWAPTYLLTACISEPTPAEDLIADVCRQTASLTWWDAEAQVVRWRMVHPLHPDETLVSIDDAEHIVSGTVEVEQMTDRRISRRSVRFGVVDWSASLTEPTTYARRAVNIDASAESENEWGSQRADEELMAYWLQASLLAEVVAANDRYLDRFRSVPRLISFELHDKDATLVPADMVSITTRQLVDRDGKPVATTCRVIEKCRAEGGSQRWRYRAETDVDQTAARYAFVNYDTAPAYGSATEADKLCSYIADDGSCLVDGDPPYCVI